MLRVVVDVVVGAGLIVAPSAFVVYHPHSVMAQIAMLSLMTLALGIWCGRTVALWRAIT